MFPHMWEIRAKSPTIIIEAPSSCTYATHRMADLVDGDVLHRLAQNRCRGPRALLRSTCRMRVACSVPCGVIAPSWGDGTMLELHHGYKNPEALLFSPTSPPSASNVVISSSSASLCPGSEVLACISPPSSGGLQSRDSRRCSLLCKDTRDDGRDRADVKQREYCAIDASTARARQDRSGVPTTSRRTNGECPWHRVRGLNSVRRPDLQGREFPRACRARSRRPKSC